MDIVFQKGVKFQKDSSRLFSTGDGFRILQNEVIDVRDVDISEVENMSWMFSGAVKANLDIRNVRDFYSMFSDAERANSDISNQFFLCFFNDKDIVNKKEFYVLYISKIRSMFFQLLNFNF